MSTPKAPFETKDIHSGMLVSLIGAFLILLGGTLLITQLLHRYFISRQPRSNQASSPWTSAPALPPEPRLQVNPAVDLLRMRDVENVTLQNYAWVDADKGIVRIPIARAMAILAEQGLPSRPVQKEASQ